MTQVTFDLRAVDATGRVPVDGRIRWQPVDRRVDGSVVILPEVHGVKLVAGQASAELDPGYYWFTESTAAGGSAIRLVPAAGPVSYASLVAVDPVTLDPSAGPDPAWLAMARSTVSGGTVVGDNLQLSRTDGTTLNAGNVRGPVGRVPGGRPGNLAVFLGDSLTAGGDDTAGNARGEAWPVYASIMSAQRVRYVRNAGIPGNRTQQMLDRFDVDVTPYAPNMVTLLCGTNDTGVTDFATWQDTVKAIVAKIRAIGAVPVLATMPPNILATPTPDRKFLVVQWNAWLRRYAAAEGLGLLDFYSVLVDPATGGYQAAYYGDGTHPNFAGAAAMGAYAANVLSAVIPPSSVVICQDDADESNAIYKGCFTGYAGTGLPTGWVDNAGLPAGSSTSYTVDAQVPGQLLTLTAAATPALRQLSFTCTSAAASLNAASAAGATSINMTVNPSTRAVLYVGSGATAEAVKVSSVAGAGSAWTVTLVRGLRYAHNAGESVVVNGVPGDRMLYTGRVTTDGGVTTRAAVSVIGAPGGGRAMSDLSRPVTRGVFLMEFVIPAGATSMGPQLQIGAGTGVVSFGQVGLYNLTRMGLV